MLPHEFFKMMADEVRLRSLLQIARQGELCVCELVAALDEPQPKISRHLAQMRNYGLLSTRRKNQWVFYSIAEDLPGWMNKIIDGLRLSKCLKKEYQQDQERLESMVNRPSC
ncbi:metalloregulator ArsR/SmtB family transcription factor [Endozoicomonas elysicola]|uniref:ArsR family transcriptional regulator n=1 Tax=Endozoicomonas elysicola TaxID=305900 RepID=A0A081KAE9_9GAMM|nr:metalloregulator ArsR/SmtB family transcription factor [Endozoicomonas elysicola]KEI71125.1 ArsR family transcriptional regulator [Endozoicomonas elysicola]